MLALLVLSAGPLVGRRPAPAIDPDIAYVAVVTGEDGTHIDAPAHFAIVGSPGTDWSESVIGGSLRAMLPAGSSIELRVTSPTGYVDLVHPIRTPRSGQLVESLTLRRDPTVVAGVLVAESLVRGEVVDENSRPIEAARVRIFEWRDGARLLLERDPSTRVDAAVRSDATGVFELRLPSPLPSIDDGRTLQVQAEAEHYLPSLLPLRPGTTTVRIVLRRSPTKYRLRVLSARTQVPASDARVYLAWSDPATAQGAVFTGATDIDGQLELEGVPLDRGVVELFASAPETTPYFGRHPATALPGQIELGPTGVWRGRVVDDASAAPVASAVLSLELPFGGEVRTTAGFDGTFEIGRLPAGMEMTYVCTSPGRTPVLAGTSIEVDPKSLTLDQDVRMTPAEELRGVVVSPDDRPIAGASVALIQSPRDTKGGEERRVEATTNREGQFVLAPAVSSALHTLVVTHAHYEDRRVTDRELSDSLAIKIVLYAGGALRGTLVTSVRGTPLHGWRVRAYAADDREGTTERSVRTQDDGTFEFEPMRAGAWRVAAEGPDGLIGLESRAYIEPQSDTVLSLAVPEPGSLVLDLRTDPGHVPNLAALVLRSSDDVSRTLQVPVRAGRAVVEGVTPGDYWLVVRAPGYLASAPIDIAVPTNGVARTTVELSLGSTLRGRVLDASTRRPISGALVAAKSSAAPTAPDAPEDALPPPSTVTAQDGSFVLEGLPTGGLVIVGQHEDYAPQVVEVEGAGREDASIDILVGVGATVTLTVKASGKPVADCHVLVDGEGFGPVGYADLTDENGVVRFLHVPAGSWTLWFLAAPNGSEQGTRFERSLRISDGGAWSEEINTTSEADTVR